MSGPAEFPLAAVQFEYDAASDELTAVGLIGTVLIDKFFELTEATSTPSSGAVRPGSC